MDFREFLSSLELPSVGSGPRRSSRLEPDEGVHRVVPVALHSRAVDALLGSGEAVGAALALLERLGAGGGGMLAAYASNVEVDALARLAGGLLGSSDAGLSREAWRVLRSLGR